MFYIGNNTIFNGDWHLNHPNIWIYEYEKRNKYINKDKYPFINSGEDIKQFYKDNIANKNQELNREFYLESEYNMLLDIYNNLEYILKNNNKIKSYINLGDFFFNPSDTKIDLYVGTPNMRLVKKIFNLLKSKNITSTLFLGNHDKETIAGSFYNNFFTYLKYVEMNNGVIISHYPYNKNNSFFEQNGIPKNTEISISIHGHTHSNMAYESLEYTNIKYVNLCIEQFM